MAGYIGRRVAFGVLVLLVVSFLAFILVYLAGDPARALAGPDTTEAALARIRTRYGLDRPLYEQYLLFLSQAVQGDLGQSFRFRTSVGPLVWERYLLTLQLAGSSVLVSALIALPLGVALALRHQRPVDQIGSTVAIVGVSTPNFWLGLILILIFADQLQVLPASGHGTWRHLVLPVATLSAYTFGLATRLVRRSMLEELSRDYVRTGRAKGLSETTVRVRHALRNALIPAVTVLGLQMGMILGGSIVVESVFAYPGVGWLMIQSVQANDLPVVRGVVLLVGASFVVINLAVDLVYAWLDPRIAYT